MAEYGQQAADLAAAAHGSEPGPDKTGEFIIDLPSHWGPSDLRGIVTLSEWRRRPDWLPVRWAGLDRPVLAAQRILVYNSPVDDDRFARGWGA